MAKNETMVDDTTEETISRQEVTIERPNISTAVFTIRGTAPYVQHAFGAKAREAMKSTQEAGSQAKKGKKKEPKDFKKMWEDAGHRTADGWYGIPAPAFRAALISACRIVGFAMTRAKLSLFIEPDGFDAADGTPLVKVSKGKPEYAEHAVRLESGVMDIHARPLWKAGWEAVVRVRYDVGQFSAEDVANLMMRVGLQVGIGEGRPDSKKSAGCGWGTFEIVSR